MTITLLGIIQVLIAIAMTAIILVQRGAGAAAGSGFGGGASATVFGSRGSGSFLTRATAILATAFIAVTIVMAVMAKNAVVPEEGVDLGVMEGVGAPVEQQLEDVPTLEPAADDVDVDDAPGLELEPESATLDDEPALEVETVEDSEG